MTAAKPRVFDPAQIDPAQIDPTRPQAAITSHHTRRATTLHLVDLITRAQRGGQVLFVSPDAPAAMAAFDLTRDLTRAWPRAYVRPVRLFSGAQIGLRKGRIKFAHLAQDPDLISTIWEFDLIALDHACDPAASPAPDPAALAAWRLTANTQNQNRGRV